MMRTASFVLALALLAATAHAQRADKDSDDDGLSDLAEIHKYLTDPNKKDSDGDGDPDGDWHERREYTYTIRTIIQVMPPYNKAAFNDDYQDARILEERKGRYIELEVVHYPLNTWHKTITGTTGWRDKYADSRQLRPYIEPGVTTNWNAAMRKDLIEGLRADGIDLDKLTDKQAVEKVSRWLMKRAKFIKTFTTYKVHFPGGKPAILPGLEEAFARKKFKPEWTTQDQFDHELLGRGMFYNKTRGSCTSSSVYLTTGLRAAGIPTRMIIAVPVVDASNGEQVEQLARRLTHHELRRTILAGIRPLEQSFAAHTFNEVFVGGRWRRLNYTALGQNILDENYFGLMTHVHTFRDLADANLAPTWGSRKPDATFQFSNPYSTPIVSDQFGKRANIPNPRVADDTREQLLTIEKVGWFDDVAPGAGISLKTVKRDGSGHVLMRIRESSFRRNQKVYGKIDKRFVLRAKGQTDVRANAERGFWGQQFYLRIPPAELKKMKKGVTYRLTAVDSKSDTRWKIAEGLGLSR